MKKFLSLIISLALLVLLCVPAFAVDGKPLLVDEAGLLSEEEFSLLNDTLNRYSEELSFDIVVVTVNGLDGKSAMEFADDYYDYNGYGYGDEHDGCLFLISMADRDWWISTTGYGITAITDYGIDYISSQVVPSLSSGDYYKAFYDFAHYVYDFVEQARNGESYDVDNLVPGDDYEPVINQPKTTADRIKELVISLVIGAVVSLIVTMIIRSRYVKAVRFNRGASNYLVPGSLALTGSYDNFLYSNVTRVKIQSESSGGGGSSTHTSSSGTSHGGGGGKF